MIRNGHFGRIEQIHVEMPQEGFARLNDLGQPMTPQQWRLRDGVIPTISLDLGVHVLQMVDFLTDVRPLQVVATQSSMGRFQDIVDNTMVLVRYSKNVEGTLWFSKAALGHRNGLRVRADGAAEWFQMEPETLLLSDSQGRRTLFDRASVNATVSRQPRYNRFKSGHPAGFLEAFANLYVDIANAITRTGDVPTTSSEFLFTARKAWEGLHVLEAIDMSARKHCWVDINWE
jgi:predicted dehydrogenase